MAWDELNSDEVMHASPKGLLLFLDPVPREFGEIARARALPPTSKLADLWDGECNTANLSPWPGIAATGERMNHDEFMRRLLDFDPVGSEDRLTAAGLAYLDKTRSIDDAARASSIASYEDGGLSRVFGAMLRAPHWYGRGQRAFRFFLEEHIRFDSADGAGHGELSRHLPIDDRILPLWTTFRDLLATAVPKLATVAAVARRAPRAPVLLPRLRLV